MERKAALPTRHERLNNILEILARDGRLSVEDAVGELDVSKATVRRDFDHLASQQLLTRTRGGAVSNNTSYDLPLRYKAARYASEKQRIADAAAGLVTAGQIIGINGGTTTSEVARALAGRNDFRGTPANPAVTIVTNAINIANELVVRPHIKIVATGGVVRPQSYELVGHLATDILEQLTLDVTFLGVNAFHPEEGALAHDEGEAAVNRIMTSRSRSVVVVADSSKLGKRAFARICPTSRVDTLITDAGIATAMTKALEEAGIEVVAV